MGAQSNISMAFARMLQVTELIDFRALQRYTDWGLRRPI
jgi:hypothetical protein